LIGSTQNWLNYYGDLAKVGPNYHTQCYLDDPSNLPKRLKSHLAVQHYLLYLAQSSREGLDCSSAQSAILRLMV